MIHKILKSITKIVVNYKNIKLDELYFAPYADQVSKHSDNPLAEWLKAHESVSAAYHRNASQKSKATFLKYLLDSTEKMKRINDLYELFELENKE